MTFIIRSNAALKYPENAVGNIHGYYGPQDYAAMLDFTHQSFTVAGKKVGFEDALTLTRASEASYLDIFGRQRTVAANRPRFGFIENPAVSGLLLETSGSNFLSGDANGSSFSASAAAQSLALSWEGDGEVEPVSASELTLLRETHLLGRTFRFYSRSGAVSGTISVTGDAQRIMIDNSGSAGSYIPHGSSRSNELLELAGEALGLVSDGTGSVVMRYGLIGSGDIHAAGINGNNLRGALRMQVRNGSSGMQTAEVQAHPDGAALNQSTQIARVLGNRPNIGISGMYFENFGEKAGIISYLQANSAAASAAGATPPTAFTRFAIATGLPGNLTSTSNTTNMILTHCIIYDRMLSNEEALLAATFGA